MAVNSIPISQLTSFTGDLTTASYVPIVIDGVTFKYPPYAYHANLVGNQTIAGVKTFSSSPIVPTPTTDMQTSTKKYVDDNISALNVGEANGVATLDSTGKVPSTQMPQLVITDVFVVATEAEMLALTTAEQGDIAKRTDYSPAKTFILSASPASTLSNWVELTVSVDPNTPTVDQKAALAGNDGTPSAVNPYATDSSLIPLESFKAYSPTYSYTLNEPCFYNGVPYKSLSAGNVGNTPDTSPLYWEVTGGAGNATNVGFDVPNGQFESGILDWNTYADTAGTMPVDGTGGTATITIAHNTTNPLNGSGDLVLTKPSSNCRGNGLSTDIIIDDGQLTNPVEVSFDYISSVAYVAGYLDIYVYDITNAVFCPCTTVTIPATFGSVSKCITAFFPNATSNNYRLCYHVADSSSTAWTFELDNVQVGNQKANIGAAITPWVDYPAGSYTFPSSATPVAFTSGKIPLGAVSTNPIKGTTSEDHAQWSRNGEDILVRFDYKQTASGNAGSGIYLFALPAGMTIDLTKNPVNSIVGQASISNISDENSASSTSMTKVVVYSATMLCIYYTSNSSGTDTFAPVSSGYYQLSTATITYRFNARVSCAQFSVNAIFNGVNEPFYLSNTESTINTNGVVAKTKIGIDGTPILANTTTTYYDCSLPRALLPNETAVVQVRSKIDGQWYDAVNCLIESLFASMAPTITTVGSNGEYSWFSGIFLAKINTGVIRVRFSTNVTHITSFWTSTTAGITPWSSIISASDGFNAWRIRIGQSGMSEAKPTVFASYTAGTAATHIDFATKIEDTHNAVTIGTGVWKFTAPMAGIYDIAVSVPGTSITVTLYKNGAQYGGTIASIAASTQTVSGTKKVHLYTNDYIYIICSGAPLTGSEIQIAQIAD